MITIKVLGTGCSNCKKVEQITKRAIANLDIDVEIVKVTDLTEIMAYDVLSTPSLVISEKIVSSGRVPDEAEIIAWVTSAVN